MRSTPSVLHLDMDAFFAAVEQRDKPSLRGRPVIVGGVGGRGVVSTASYEARRFGARSAMPTATARRLCPPGTAFLSPRFPAYRAASEVVMGRLREVSPLVEPLSIDEAYVDLAAGGHDLDVGAVTTLAAELKARLLAELGLTASIGIGSSKLVAKIGSDLRKPDGLLVVPAGEELTTLADLSVTRIPGVGPATESQLHRRGVSTVAELRALEQTELVSMFGTAHGTGLFALARAEDDRAVVPDRAAKSVSAEETFDVDVTSVPRLHTEIDLLAARVVARLKASGTPGRTVTLKVRRYDFTGLTRSATLPQPTDDLRTVVAIARRLLAELDVTDGVRLVGVGVSSLATYVQDDLFADDEHEVTTPTGDAPTVDDAPEGPAEPPAAPAPEYRPGADVVHATRGAGWVWGSGHGRVTVRFEGPHTPPGPVRTFATTDPELLPADPPVW
ncbi:DNA polymerase IV [Jatrophihabitans sp. YIM 134969]